MRRPAERYPRAQSARNVSAGAVERGETIWSLPDSEAERIQMADQFHHAAPSIILVLRTENIFVCSIKMVCRDLLPGFDPRDWYSRHAPPF